MGDVRTGIRGQRAGWAQGAKRTLKVTARDHEILYLVGVCGVVRTRDVTRFSFGSRGTANDRLRKLFCAGLLECHVPSLAADNCYSLTTHGRDVVADALDVDADSLRVVRTLPKKLDHQLAVTDLRLHVVLGCRASARYELAQFETDADLGRERHAALLELVPDARVVIRDRVTDAKVTIFGEIDLGSEATTWLVRHKLAVYARYTATCTPLYGTLDPPIIVVFPSLRRARNVARTMDALRVSARVVFALAPLLNEATVLGAAYALPSELVAHPQDDAADLFIHQLLP